MLCLQLIRMRQKIPFLIRLVLQKLLISVGLLVGTSSNGLAQLNAYIPELRCSVPNYMLQHSFPNSFFSARADFLTPVGTSFKGYYYMAYSCVQTQSPSGTFWGGKRNFACLGKTGLGAYYEAPDDGLNMELFEDDSSSVSPAIGTTEDNLYYIYYEDNTRQHYYYRLNAADGSAGLVDKKVLSGMDGFATGFTACRYRADQILVMGFDGTGMLCCIYRENGTELQLERQIRLSTYTCYQMADITPSSVYLAEGKVCLAWTGGGYRPRIALFENNTITKSFSYTGSSFPGGMKPYGHNPKLYRMDADAEIHLFYRGQKSSFVSDDPKLYHTSFTAADFQFDGAEILGNTEGAFQVQYSPLLIPGIPGKSANLVFVQASGSSTGLSFFNAALRFVPLYRWQGDNLSDELTLKNLILPGTHLSAMTSGDDYFYAASLQASLPPDPEPSPTTSCSDCNRFNQIYTVEDQLKAGVRYLDIPLGASGGNYTDPESYHAVRLIKSTDPDQIPTVCAGTKLTDLMNTLETFLKANPTEFVVLHVSNGDGQIDKIRSYFQRKAYLLYQRQEGEHALGDIVTKSIAAFRGKVILVTDDLYDGESFGALHYSGTTRFHSNTSEASDLYAYQKKTIADQSSLTTYKIADWYTTNLTSELNCPKGDLSSCLKQARSFTKSISQSFRCGKIVYGIFSDIKGIAKGDFTKAIDLTKIGFSLLQNSLVGRGLTVNKGLASDLHAWKDQGILTQKSMPNVLLMDAYEYWNADVCIDLTDALNREEYVSLYNGSIDLDVRILPVECGQENGQIYLRAYGAYPPFTFFWNRYPLATDSLSGLPAGRYEGYVTDRRGHKKSFSYQVPVSEESFKSLATGKAIATVEFSQPAQEHFFSENCYTLIAKAQLKEADSAAPEALVATVWAGTAIQQQNDYPFVQRSYDFRHLSKQTNAAGWLTLYFTKTDWAAYNASHTDKLPERPGDTTAYKRLCIAHYSSNSLSGTGTVESFSGTPEYLFPKPENIRFNDTLNCWEVRFYTNQLGGFFLKAYDGSDLNTWISGKADASQLAPVVSWSVDEHRAYRYYLQKSVNGGTSFTTLQMLSAMGQGQQQYTYVDTSKKANSNHTPYYQVILVDRSGKTLLRKTLAIDPESQPLRVYPNPAQTEVHIESLNATQAMLSNSQGNLLQTFELGVGDNRLQTGMLASGLYLIRTANGKTAKLLIQR
ncbi:MAG: T9SS type A sorting domain-containing protein [Sphingobacteriales bacterium]|nr:MAG: T9SS type A sorting domain-containing protein [Sphingobacteriales bacterium]